MTPARRRDGDIIARFQRRRGACLAGVVIDSGLRQSGGVAWFDPADPHWISMLMQLNPNTGEQFRHVVTGPLALPASMSWSRSRGSLASTAAAPEPPRRRAGRRLVGREAPPNGPVGVPTAGDGSGHPARVSTTCAASLSSVALQPPVPMTEGARPCR